MGLLHEKRLDSTVQAGDIGVGEQIEVCTKMGTPVASGIVHGSTPFGIILKESGMVVNFYPAAMYLFSVIEEDLEMQITNLLTDTSPDARVEQKLKDIEEAGDPQPSGPKGVAKPIEKNGKKGDEKKDDKGKEADKDDEEKDEKPEKEPEPEPEPNGDDKKDPVAQPEASIDTENLPQDIKRAIIDAKQMDKEQLNNVMSEISDAAMKGLKRAGVKEQRLFGVVQKIQNSVYRILTGKSPNPKKNGNGKKNGKKGK